MSELSNVSGIGEKKLKSLEKLNIKTLSDALFFYPRDYEDRTVFKSITDAVDGEKCGLVLTIHSVSSNNPYNRRGVTVTKILATDGFYTVEITCFNQPYLEKSLKTDKEYLFYGVINKKLSQITMNTPVIEVLSEKSKRILPIYPLTTGLSQADIKKVTYHALKTTKPTEFLPDYICKKYGFSDIFDTLQKIHFPKSMKDVNFAKRRIIFDEMFLYFVKLQFMKKRQNKSYKITDIDYSKLINSLEYSLTNAQIRSIEECVKDMSSGEQMSRLLQGDVGSGKTIVATVLSYICSKNKKQIAFMVPTEILAIQHYNEISELLGKFDIKTELLTGSTTAKNKRIIKENLKNGLVDIVIGTHAIITDDTDFLDLGLVIVDEQHRFGVMQRAKLTSKGDNPHIFVMSATPIPRTLSLIMYGDLDVSIIDEMPKGRIPIDTFVVEENMRKRIFSFIKKHVDENSQVYIVCPLVEESENLDILDATRYFEGLKKVFPEYNIGLVHGKMKPKEKDKVMSEFANGEINILISTTVIEVGVNVPNATLMIIESAERFGLSALHQLRGRVGRGKKKSYCVLFQKKPSDRLQILAKTNDGFEIAKEDLEIRGPGDLFSNRQSGMSNFDFSEFNMKILKCANEEATELLKNDPNLVHHEKLRKNITLSLENSDTNIFN